MNRILLTAIVLAMAPSAFAEPKTKTFIDIHRGLPKNMTEAQLAADHQKDVEAEKKHKGVKYVRGWYDKDTGTLMCECHAATKEECEAVHKEAHDGHAADEIHEVVEQH